MPTGTNGPNISDFWEFPAALERTNDSAAVCNATLEHSVAREHQQAPSNKMMHWM